MPTAKPCSVAWRASLVELLPVFPITKRFLPKTLTVWLMSMICSSQSINCKPITAPSDSKQKKAVPGVLL